MTARTAGLARTTGRARTTGLVRATVLQALHAVPHPSQKLEPWQISMGMGRTHWLHLAGWSTGVPWVPWVRRLGRLHAKGPVAPLTAHQVLTC